MRINLKLLIIFSFFVFFENNKALKIDRVILSSDSNPMYLDFWPIVAKIWKNNFNIVPTLALIGDETIKVDETIGDVIRFEPIQGIPNSFYSQVIRLLLPIIYENDTCLISDIDMIPLNLDYFTKPIEKINDDCFVVYRDKAYIGNYDLFPMCYNVSKGKTFQEIFKIKNINEIPEKIKFWFNSADNRGWSTDEFLLHKYLINWSEQNRLILLGQSVEKRVDRSNWFYNINKIKNGYYIDSHSLRPYKQYKNEIDKLIQIRFENKK